MFRTNLLACSAILFGLLSSLNPITGQDLQGAQSFDRFNLNKNLEIFFTVFFDRSVNKIYVGGVNKIYQFDPRNISVPENEITWSPMEFVLRLCSSFQSDRILCQNNIKVLSAINDTHLYTCGTMALRPECAFIQKSDFTIVPGSAELGRWKTPKNPYESAISVFANQTLFTAARGTNHNNDPIISRALNGVTLRTVERDSYWLSDPHFVGGYHVEYESRLQDKVMLFFREKAEEFKPYDYGLSSSPHDRNIVSRVATVCVNDHGGSAYVGNRRFATYVKKTIVCDVPSRVNNQQTTFRYTNLVSTFEIPDQDTSGESIVYGIFTTPDDAIFGSAVCAYKMNDLKRELGINSYWKKDTENGIKTPFEGNLPTGPGMCVEETRRLPQSRLTFSLNHPIKFGNVFRSHHTPFFQESGTKYTHITVDKVFSERSSIGENVTVVYLISNTGLLKRLVFSESSQYSKNWTLPEIQIVTLGDDEKVVSMVIGNESLYVTTDHTIVQMPLAACKEYKSCFQCQERRDPYCVVSQNGGCSSVFSKTDSELMALQDIEVTCPSSQEAPRDTTDGNFVETLQESLSQMIERNAQCERRITGLMSENNILTNDLESCTARNEQFEAQNSELRQNLTTIEESLGSSQSEHNKTTQKFQHCLRTRKFFMNHAVRMAVDLRERPTQEQYQRQIRALTEARDSREQGLLRCQATQTSVIRKATQCVKKLRDTLNRVETLNETCTQEKATQQSQFDALLQGMSSQKSKLNLSNKALTSVADRNSKQLQLCQKRSRGLTNENAFLRKKGREAKRQAQKFKQEGKKLIAIFKNFRSQHQCIDGRKWLLLNSTGNMYTFIDDKATFEEANTRCRSMDASLASVPNAEQLRHIANSIRSVSPNSYYWMKLSRASPDRAASRTSMSDVSNGIYTYCAVVKGTNRWEYSSCLRRRRFICQRAITSGDSSTQNQSA